MFNWEVDVFRLLLAFVPEFEIRPEPMKFCYCIEGAAWTAPRLAIPLFTGYAPRPALPTRAVA